MLYQVSIKACIIDHHSTMVPYYDIDRVSIGSIVIVTELLYINKVATVSAGTSTRFSDLNPFTGNNAFMCWAGDCFLWAVMHLCICKISRKEAPATYQQTKQGWLQLCFCKYYR